MDKASSVLHCGENRGGVVVSVFTGVWDSWRKQNTWVPAVSLEAKEVGIKDGTDIYCLLYTLLQSWKYLPYAGVFLFERIKKF